MKPLSSNRSITIGVIACLILTVALLSPSFPFGPTAVAAQAISLPGALVDDAHLEKAVLFNTATGDYRFCCGGAVVASGRGTVTVNGGLVNIHHQKGDRIVDVSINPNGSGAASIQRMATDGTTATICQISDAVMVGDIFACPFQPLFSRARVDPINRIGELGEDLFSGNYNWSLPLLALAGRAGLDLGFSLSLNSLLWTVDGNFIGFDADSGFPAPGFRLGFPSFGQQGYVSQTAANALLLVMPSGKRIELRQVTPSLYESADSSWLQLDTSTNPMILRAADGTQLSFQLYNGVYQCTQIKDRNGNLITTA